MNTSSQQVNQTAQVAGKNYFNIHSTGIGRLKRIRTVNLKKGSPFLACSIEALVGNTSRGQKPKSRFLDVRVSGSKAQEVVQQYAETVNAGKEVVIGFCVGDIWADVFTYEKGSKVGQEAISVKGRLLFVDWVLVDNKLCYEADPDKKRILVPDMVNLASPGNHFNLYTTGAAYLSRIRTETPEDGKEPYLSCTLGALVGEYGNNLKPEYRYFNVRVYPINLKTYQLVEGCEEPIIAESKVMVGFRLNDIWPKTFTLNKGENAGKKGVAFQSQLIEIDWVRIDNQLTYKAERQQQSIAPVSQEAAQAVPTQAPITQVAGQPAAIAPEQSTQPPVTQATVQPVQAVSVQEQPPVTPQVVEQTVATAPATESNVAA